MNRLDIVVTINVEESDELEYIFSIQHISGQLPNLIQEDQEKIIDELVNEWSRANIKISWRIATTEDKQA